MTRALRTRHRRTMLALAVLLPGGVAVALAARPAAAPPAARAQLATPQAGAPRWQGRMHADRLALDAQLVDAGERLVLELALASEEPQPELLVYLARADADPADGPSEGSLLLGTLRPGERQRYPLPHATPAQQPTLLLYDLAHGRVAAQLAIGAGS
ncbi:MAG: hypothetical protein AB1689_28865 [Thermodesulfobacteriota bacterium]